MNVRVLLPSRTDKTYPSAAAQLAADLHEETFKADVLAVLFPAAVSNALQTLGVQAGRQTSKVLVRKYISKNVLKTAIRWAAKYIGIKVTQRAIITKAVPVVGAVIAAWAPQRIDQPP